MRRFSLFRAPFVALLVLASPSLAELTPIGDPFVVNTYSTGDQVVPRVAVGEEGALVTWYSVSPGGESVRGQRYAPDGAPLGEEFRIDVEANQTNDARDIETCDGCFFATWVRILTQDPLSSVVVGRRIAASGDLLGAELVISQDTSRYVGEIELSRGVDGRFLVTYDSSGAPPAGEPWDWNDRDFTARLLDEQGSSVGAEFMVSAASPYMRGYGSAAARGEAGFVLVWESKLDDEAFGPWELAARLVNSNGVPLGAQFQVAQASSSRLEWPDVAAATDGSFIVAWAESTASLALRDIRARRYASSGAPLGSSFTVSTGTSSDQNEPTVAVDSAGGFHVAWSHQPGGDFQVILARSFDADGLPMTDDFAVSEETSALQLGPALAIGPSGHAIVTWREGGVSDGPPGPDGDGSTVVGRHLELTGVCLDGDGDGYGSPGDESCSSGPEPDCDDADPGVNPGQAEIPGNGIDDDCDPTTPAGCNAEQLDR